MPKKIIITLILLFLFFSTLLSFSSCAPSLEFGEITTCSEIEKPGGKPLNAKESFDIEDNNIYATIRVDGVKADDNYRYSVIKKDSGEVLFDTTNEYSTEEQGYVEGHIFFEYEGVEGKIRLDPGTYEVIFYHNGEVVDTTDFIINSPEVEIMEVDLARTVDDFSMEPLDMTTEFEQQDDIYVTIKLSNNVEGDIFNARWFYEGEVINQKELAIEENYFDPNYISFSITNDQNWEPGDYRVEISYNGEVVGNYDFVVVSPPEQDTSTDLDPFSKGTIYSSDKYEFLLAIPDDWQVKETENENGLTMDIIYVPEQIPFAFTFLASTEDEAIEERQYSEAALEIANQSIKPGWELLEETSGEFTNSNNIDLDDYVYVYNDGEGNEWSLVFDFFKGGNRTYMLFTVSAEEYYEEALPIYEGIVNSFDFLDQS